nr:MAG TPA: Radical SAM superfamily [Caudoviricetes sp.]DAU17552.1 MAG TPA: Radical SAM superfamily [Caudoviricetes sp.]
MCINVCNFCTQGIASNHAFTLFYPHFTTHILLIR